MKPEKYIPLVERARRGDHEAFGELVRGYQDLVTGSAYGWLGNIETAREVAQETFLEAHLHLHQLLDPAAFPGWLKRIVHKHCDRVTRRRQLATTSLELDHAEPALAAGEPDQLFQVDEQNNRLRFAVESLPSQERQVVSLHYFAEATGAELAAFLELPLPTVKKRLRNARARLKEEGERLMENTADKLRPSKNRDLTAEVSFFVALRAGDSLEVARLLRQQPTLVDAQQNWGSDLVMDGLLPFANKATALITAIERDDLAVLDLLLEAGADVNGACGCETGESPLWAATLLNRQVHARRLLERGASPNRASSTGNYPLHLAAMRNHSEIARMLLEHGADPELLDSGPQYPRPWSPADGQPLEDRAGRTAAQWASANGHADLAELIEAAGKAAARSQDQEGKNSISAAAQSLVSGELVHTGIKALDLFAPLQRGGLIRLPFKAGVGMVVLLGELCHRFCSVPQGAALWTGFSQPPFDLADWETDMDEFGLRSSIEHSLASFAESPETRRKAFLHGIEKAETLRDAGLDVLAVVLSSDGFESDVEASLLRFSRATQKGSITTIVVTTFPEKAEVWSALQPPYSGQIVLDRARAKSHLFPALHPLASLSSLRTIDGVGHRHVELAERAQRLLEVYERADPAYVLVQADQVPADAELASAQRLLRYLSQPFHITEPFTGRAGELVDRARMLDEVEALLGEL